MEIVFHKQRIACTPVQSDIINIKYLNNIKYRKSITNYIYLIEFVSPFIKTDTCILKLYTTKLLNILGKDQGDHKPGLLALAQ